ncbi:MotA/TolQ/ExbB proton channel family protein [Mesoflavibacter sp. SCSIO 43206]|uniref:MotA/TolQ/ExbB proton channel family protein n=1 Tax=Mesoflavibacter sp. SCSIO 43206 TaxID=2779362 RepID=UPI001CA86CE2|nr:MotA/TolQ/ExbB proton channel family protein [Mesoflavibacter sp. SCSIO 43206]UAB75326.1 MotA/TolQ/ExbB proton channel family protein [Mesoflavibacter sp. SCSIO 43206]
MTLLTIFNHHFLVANLFQEGGPLFMSLILIAFLTSLFFIIKGFIKLKSHATSTKEIKLAIDCSLLALVLGFLGSVLGLIQAFDSVEAMGNPDPSIFAGGLKISLLTATFGLFSFVVTRIGIFILRLANK